MKLSNIKLLWFNTATAKSFMESGANSHLISEHGAGFEIKILSHQNLKK